jgi:hypothetical protein
MISMSFQLVGFLLTYLLHTTHAAKNGSRAGLGITLVHYGFYMKGSGGSSGPSNGQDPQYSQPADPNSHNFDPNQVNQAAQGMDSTGSGSWSEVASSEWLAYILMVVGWFILIRAVSDFLKARRHEQLVLQSPDRGLNVPIIASGEEAETVVWGMSHVLSVWCRSLYANGTGVRWLDSGALIGLNYWLESSKWIISDILATLTLPIFKIVFVLLIAFPFLSRAGQASAVAPREKECFDSIPSISICG